MGGPAPLQCGQQSGYQTESSLEFSNVEKLTLACMKQGLSQPSTWFRQKPVLCPSLHTLDHLSFSCITRRQGRRNSSPHLSIFAIPKKLFQWLCLKIWAPFEELFAAPQLAQLFQLLMFYIYCNPKPDEHRRVLKRLWWRGKKCQMFS